MAALIRHGLQAVKAPKTFLPFETAVRHNGNNTQRPEVVRRIDSVGVSMENRGFRRNVKPYRPGDNVINRIEKICKKQSISTADETKLEDSLVRFNLFTACEKELGHSLPNSKLCYIETIGDLKDFYLTPINTMNPLEAFKTHDLPKNLQITYTYNRFHPDTDTMFNGKTAFPKSSTLVTGLRYRKKYLGHKQEDPYRQ